MSRRAAFLVRTGLVLVSLLLAALAAEVTLRLAGYNYSPMTIESRRELTEAIPATEGDTRALHVFQDDHFTYDPDLLWRPRAGRSVFNSQGYRGPELEPDKLPGERRILALGDSNTLGWSGEHGPNWPEDLGELLSGTEPGFVVINAGVWGYSAFQGEQRLRELLPLRPDLVLVSFGGNDAHPVYASDAEYARRISGPRLPVLAGLKLGEVIAAFRDRWGRAQPPTGEWQRLELRRRVPLDEYREHLRQIAALARSNGAIAVFLTRPYRGRSEDREHWRYWAPEYRLATVEIAAETGAPLVDVYGAFKDRRELFKDESHFTAFGHRLAAKLVYDRLAPILVAQLGVDPGRVLPAGRELAAALDIDLGGRAARRYLRSGFAARNDFRGRTAVKNNRPRAVIEFELEPIAGPYLLMLEARPFRRARVVSVGAAVNGHELGEVQVRGVWDRYLLEVPGGILLAGFNRLELSHGTAETRSTPAEAAVVLYDRVSLAPSGRAGAPPESP